MLRMFVGGGQAKLLSYATLQLLIVQMGMNTLRIIRIVQWGKMAPLDVTVRLVSRHVVKPVTILIERCNGVSSTLSVGC